MLVSPCHIVGTQTMEGLQCELVGCVEPRTWPSEWIYIVTKRRFIYSYGLTFCTFYLLPPPSSLFLQELEGNEDTDDESSISNDDGSLASESKDVQNDVVVKLEEVADWEQNHHHTAESPSTDGPSASNLEDVQNVAVVKLEEVDWEHDYLQQTAERPSTNGPQVSDLMEDVPIKLPIEKRILLRVLHLMTS